MSRRRNLWLGISAVCLALAVAQCGDSLAGPGEFCESTRDCVAGLECRNNICLDPDPGDCQPACLEDVETCFQGACMPIGDPNDKDGDGVASGSGVGQDCNDFDASILPGAYEYCDGVDNDCDGATDEDCPPCRDGDTQTCGTDLGQCSAGTQTCQAGDWTPCNGTAPVLERCDGEDNDCDGRVDEICPCADTEPRACGADVGVCRLGTQSCENNQWTGCLNGELPRAEACNAQDDDCDGLTDEGFNLGVPCQGLGECGAGTVECAAELDWMCSTMPGGTQDASSVEVCDGQDDDCDGLTDENLEADTVPNLCGLAEDLLGLPDNDPASTREVRGNLFPAGDEDWYKITATDDVAEDVEDLCDRFHFRAVFAENPDELRMDVYVDGCDGAHVDLMDCDEYHHAYDLSVAGAVPPRGQCPCRTSSIPDFAVCSSEPKVFYIRVHAGATPPSCNTYRLVFSNGVLP